MSVIEDKVRRRLAPFVAEGRIGAPDFSGGSPNASPLTVAVRLTAAKLPRRAVEAALQDAMRDLGAEARLVISPA
jgi:hypothetical protein